MIPAVHDFSARNHASPGRDDFSEKNRRPFPVRQRSFIGKITATGGVENHSRLRFARRRASIWP